MILELGQVILDVQFGYVDAHSFELLLDSEFFALRTGGNLWVWQLNQCIFEGWLNLADQHF